MPQMPIEYVHRIGRTGRAGRSGEAITFITSRQKRNLQTIERYIDRSIHKAKLPTAQDILQKREDEFMQMLVERIEKTDSANVILGELMQMGYPAEQIATAVIDMLAEKEFAAPVKEISEVRERSRGSKGRSRERSRSKSS